MRVDFYGLAFETPRVTFYLWSPWRATALEHRLFESVSKVPRVEAEAGPDERRLHVTDPKALRAAVQVVARVLKGWQEEADAASERRSGAGYWKEIRTPTATTTRANPPASGDSSALAWNAAARAITKRGKTSTWKGSESGFGARARKRSFAPSNEIICRRVDRRRTDYKSVPHYYIATTVGRIFNPSLRGAIMRQGRPIRRDETLGRSRRIPG